MHRSTTAIITAKEHERDISTNAHVQTDRSIFGMHVMNYFASLGIFMHQGCRIGRRG